MKIYKSALFNFSRVANGLVYQHQNIAVCKSEHYVKNKFSPPPKDLSITTRLRVAVKENHKLKTQKGKLIYFHRENRSRG